MDNGCLVCIYYLVSWMEISQVRIGIALSCFRHVTSCISELKSTRHCRPVKPSQVDLDFWLCFGWSEILNLIWHGIDRLLPDFLVRVRLCAWRLTVCFDIILIYPSECVLTSWAVSKATGLVLHIIHLCVACSRKGLLPVIEMMTLSDKHQCNNSIKN